MTKQKRFISAIADQAVSQALARRDAGKPWSLPSVCIAQAAHESGWGCSGLALNAHNLFGIKWTSGCPYPAYNSKTGEYVDGRYITIVDAFRAYPSWEDSIRDYYRLICDVTRYRKATCTSDYAASITEIAAAGYCTSPTYAQKVIKIIEQYNLTAYDVAVTECPYIPLPERGYYQEVDRSAGVVEVQKALNEFGASLVVDGIYGRKTSQAVRDFQKSNGLTVDGLFGRKTLAKILELKEKKRNGTD